MTDTAPVPVDIAHLPELVDALAPVRRALVERLFQIVTTQGEIVPPDALKLWIEQTFGSLPGALQQRVVRVTNRWTFEGATFNPLRARRPGSGATQQAPAVPAEVVSRIEEQRGKDDRKQPAASRRAKALAGRRASRLRLSPPDGEHVDFIALLWSTIDMEYQRDEHRVHLLVSHLLWCPKRRKRVLVGHIADECVRLLRQTCQEHGWHVLEVAVQPDQVPLFVRVFPPASAADVVRAWTGLTAPALRAKHPALKAGLPSLWTSSSFASTAGQVSQATIARYSAAQQGWFSPRQF